MIDGVLLVYHRPDAPWIKDASTVMEHVGAFAAHSRNRIWEVNTDLGFPPGLAKLDFRVVIVHYCVFGMGPYRLDERWLDWLDRSKAYKVAFFQDECTRCQRRFRFLNEHAFDCVYTCLEPSEFGKVYGRYTDVPKLVSNVPGYVPEHLPEVGRRFARPDAEREIDVGYRGRPLPAYLGRGAMEKHEIGVRFAELAATVDCAWTWRPRRPTACTATTGTASWRTAAACWGWSRACRCSTWRTRSSASGWS